MSPRAPVLVVDDRAEDRLAIEMMLDGRAWDVVTADGGHAALRRVLERDFAVILMDVRMPGLDGLETARIIKQRERSRHTPIIFLTAADPDVRALYRGYSAGAIDYLTKPIDRDVLRAKTAVFVELFEKDRRIEEQASALRDAERRAHDREVASLRAIGQRRYENLAEAIPDVVWIAGPDGRLLYTNRRFDEATGRGLSACRERGLASVIAPEDLPAWRTRWDEARAAGTTLEIACRILDRENQRRWHLCRAMPERDADGEIVAWLGTLSDHDDLHRALDAAESAVRARDEFLSLASHELRTPLSTLQLRLRSLGRRVDGDDELSRMVASAVRQSERLTRLVDDLLDVSRIATGQLTLRRERVEVDGLLHEIADRFSEAAAAARATLELVPATGVVSTLDRLRIDQAVQNVVGNAIKHAPGTRIVLSAERVDERLRIRVRDHGPGIPEADLDRVFERFERVSTKRHVEGLGLGLFLVREIVRAHGGTVGAARPPGGGTEITIELPLDLASTPELAPDDGPPTARTLARIRESSRLGRRSRAS